MFCISHSSIKLISTLHSCAITEGNCSHCNGTILGMCPTVICQQQSGCNYFSCHKIISDSVCCFVSYRLVINKQDTMLRCCSCVILSQSCHMYSTRVNHKTVTNLINSFVPAVGCKIMSHVSLSSATLFIWLYHFEPVQSF